MQTTRETLTCRQQDIGSFARLMRPASVLVLMTHGVRLAVGGRMHSAADCGGSRQTDDVVDVEVGIGLFRVVVSVAAVGGRQAVAEQVQLLVSQVLDASGDVRATGQLQTAHDLSLYQEQSRLLVSGKQPRTHAHTYMQMQKH